LSSYNQVIKLEPEYIGAYIQRGYIRKDKGLKEEAIADLQKAISLLHKESMMDKVRELQLEIKNIRDEINNAPWWQTRVF
jgi:regulator of sirC expression with transglutaminase-like and TPR domain